MIEPVAVEVKRGVIGAEGAATEAVTQHPNARSRSTIQKNTVTRGFSSRKGLAHTAAAGSVISVPPAAITTRPRIASPSPRQKWTRMFSRFGDPEGRRKDRRQIIYMWKPCLRISLVLCLMSRPCYLIDPLPVSHRGHKYRLRLVLLVSKSVVL